MNQYVVGQKYNGFTYVGEYSNPKVNAGTPLPMFEMSNESAESWNAMARKQFLRYYREEHGHDPIDLEAEYAKYIRQAYLAIGRTDLAEGAR